MTLGTLIIGHLLGLVGPPLYIAVARSNFVFATAPHHASISSNSIFGFSVVISLLLVGGLLVSAVDRGGKQWALLDSLIEQAPEAVVLLDADKRVVRANRAFSDLFGYGPKEVSGRRL